MVQIKNRRPEKSKKEKNLSIDCLGELRRMIENPPDGIEIFQEGLICSSESLCITFMCTEVEEIVRTCNLKVMVCDYTFQTNREGILLGCIGPCGLAMSNKGPVMRMVPYLFQFSSAENEAAQRSLLEQYLARMKSFDSMPEDGFFDCHCLQAVVNACRDSGLPIYSHRCLQHVKGNVTTESSRRCSESGQPRLRNRELLSALLEWVQFSATLPNDIEFDVFWGSILQRMSASDSPTDWNEPDMSDYLRKHILDDSGQG